MTNIGASELSLGGVYDILFNGKKLKITDHTVAEMQASFDFLKKTSEEKVVYGINTGLGPMAPMYRMCLFPWLIMTLLH